MSRGPAARFTVQDGLRIASAVRKVEGNVGVPPARRVTRMASRRNVHEAFLAELTDVRSMAGNDFAYEYAWIEVQWAGEVNGYVTLTGGRTSTVDADPFAMAAVPYPMPAAASDIYVGQVVPMEYGVSQEDPAALVTQMVFQPPSGVVPAAGLISAVNGTPPNVTYDVKILGQAVQLPSLQGLTPIDREFDIADIDYIPAAVGDACMVIVDDQFTPQLIAYETQDTDECPTSSEQAVIGPGSFPVPHGATVFADLSGGDVTIEIPDTVVGLDAGQDITISTFNGAAGSKLTLSSALLVNGESANTFQVNGALGTMQLRAVSTGAYLLVSKTASLIHLDKTADLSIQGWTDQVVTGWTSVLDDAMGTVMDGTVTFTRDVIVQATAAFNLRQFASGNRTGAAVFWLERNQGSGWAKIANTAAQGYVDIDFGTQAISTSPLQMQSGDQLRVIASDVSGSAQSNPLIVAEGTKFEILEL